MTTVRPLEKPLDRPLRLGVLISGGGTTLANFIDAIADGRMRAEIAMVIASKNCRGIDLARRAGLPVEVVSRKDFANEEEFSRPIFDLLRQARVDLVALAGFLWRIEIPDDFRYRVLNIHPGLLPSFGGHGCYGHHVHESVLARGAKISGCTVHFADQEYDHGPIILQKGVEVLDDDTPDTLAARVFQAECQAYPEAIQLFASGRLEVSEGRVRVRPELGR